MPRSTAGRYAGISQAAGQLAQGVQQGEVQNEERQLRREQARTTQRIQNAQLTKAEAEAKIYSDPAYVQQQQQVILAQLREQQNKLDRQEIFRTLDAYRSDGDSRHLNRLAAENLTFKQLMNGITNYSNIDVRNDADLLRRHGLEPEDINEAANKEFIKITNNLGEERIVTSTDFLYNTTGYIKYLDREQRKEQLELATIASTLRKNKSPFQKEVEDIAAVTGQTEQEVGTKLAEKKLTSKSAQDVKAIEDTKKMMFDSVGGEEAFYNTDFSKRENQSKVSSTLPVLLKMQNVDVSKHKKEIGDVQVLLSLGAPGAKLTDKQTGVIDNTLLNVKKYITDNVEGVAATSAYAAFRNSVRHALYGSALTATEVKSFNEAFGTLKQQTGVVLEAFKTALTQVEAKMNAIGSMLGPEGSHYYLGAGKKKLELARMRIQERINAIEEYNKTGKFPEPEKESKAEDAAESSEEPGEVTPTPQKRKFTFRSGASS